MEATCIRIEINHAPVDTTPVGRLARVTLHVTVDGRPIAIDLAKRIRPYIGALRGNRRQALVDTLPDTIRIEERRSSKGLEYVVVKEDLAYWAELALRKLTATKPYPDFPIPVA